MNEKGWVKSNVTEIGLSSSHRGPTVYTLRACDHRPPNLTLPQVAQAHYMNADVTLACERCCVTKRLFTKACMGCKRFFLKERKNVMFVNKIDLPYCLFVFFVGCPRLRPF